jgi:hypothetical protein
MYTRIKDGSSIKLLEKRAEMPEGGWGLYKEEPLYTTPPAAQRPWVGLTGAEINANEILRYHFSLNNGPVTRAGMAVVDTVTALLKAKNHG